MAKKVVVLHFSYIYINMMEYKDFFSDRLDESMTMTVYDADYSHRKTDTVLSLSFRLLDLAVEPVLNKMNPQEKEFFRQHRVPEILTSDGDDYDKPVGIVNFYTGGFSPDAIKKVVDGIKYHAKEIGIELGPIKDPEQSKMFKCQVVRIPVVTNYNINNKVKPPELNLSNDKMRLLVYEILQLHEYEDDGMNISATDLLLRVNEVLKKAESDEDFLYRYANPSTVDSEPGKATMIHGEISPEYLMMRLKQVQELCEFAIDRNFRTISIN
jgi:hypothetical protein